MNRHRERIFSALIDSLTWNESLERILSWARTRESRMVCICNVHSVVTAEGDLELREAINGADLATPDGMPVAWLIGRRRGIRQARISGPDLTVELCRQAEIENISIAFYGSTEGTLSLLRAELQNRHPHLKVAALISPPFRTLTPAERNAYTEELNGSGAGIIFIGLGCPKQEIWMADATRDLKGVLIGVGAAFEFIAGTVRRPPLWMQRNGLEWLGRLIAEPRRLWRRYVVTNTIYIRYIVRECFFRNGRNDKNA